MSWLQFGHLVVIFFHQGLQYLQKSSQAQNIIYKPWAVTKGPWLCLVTKLLLFGFVCLLSFAFVFLTSLIKFILWLKIFYGQEACGGDSEGMGSVLGMPHRVLLCFKRKPRHKSSFWFGLSDTSVMSSKTQIFPSLYFSALVSSVARSCLFMVGIRAMGFFFHMWRGRHWLTTDVS